MLVVLLSIFISVFDVLKTVIVLTSLALSIPLLLLLLLLPSSSTVSTTTKNHHWLRHNLRKLFLRYNNYRRLQAMPVRVVRDLSSLFLYRNNAEKYAHIYMRAYIPFTPSNLVWHTMTNSRACKWFIRSFLNKLNFMWKVQDIVSSQTTALYSDMEIMII